MSLKAFHIFFIAVSALLTAGFAVWAMRSFTNGGGSLMLAASIISCLSGTGLIVYGIRFLRKLKHVSFL